MKLKNHKNKNKFKLLRESLKQDQVTFATRLNLTQGYISKIENDLMQPNYKFIKGLRVEYRVNVNKLLDS
jgi:transcriptional regulator with XRE-family HTH domain